MSSLRERIEGLHRSWDDLADDTNGPHSFDFRCGVQRCEAELGLLIKALAAEGPGDVGFTCPVCGQQNVHNHSQEELQSWVSAQAERVGLRLPKQWLSSKGDSNASEKCASPSALAASENMHAAQGLVARWHAKADEIDDGSGVTLCAGIAQHYRNRADELAAALAADGPGKVCLCNSAHPHQFCPTHTPLERAAAPSLHKGRLEDGDLKCHECGQWNPCWFTANEIWNKVTPDRSGILCPSCFLRRAEKVIPNTGWELLPENSAAAPSLHVTIVGSDGVVQGEWKTGDAVALHKEGAGGEPFTGSEGGL